MFPKINDLCDSILSIKDLSRCRYFRILLIRSWLYFLQNLFVARRTLKMPILLSFLETLQPEIAQFSPAFLTNEACTALSKK